MATVELPTGNVDANDERLSVFAGDTVLVSSGQSLLSLIDEINEFNKEYLSEKSEEESEYGTFWKQVKFTQDVLAANAPEGTDPAIVKNAQKLDKAITTAQEKLQSARNDAAEFAAEFLGIEVATDKPKVDKDSPEYKRLQEQVRKPAVTLAQTLRQLADGIGLVDPDKKETILSWLKEHGTIPQIGREGELNVTEDRATAKRHRVDIWVSDAEGNALFNTDKEPLKGFTSVAAKNRKDQPIPDADTLREVYEQNGGPDSKEVTFAHEGVTFRMVKRA